MAEDILVTIEKRMSTFSKGQRRIASYILEHYNEAAFMTAAKLGVVANVSESTVVRFATLLGYEGYPEFVTDLGELVKSRLTSTQRIEVAKRRIDPERIVENVLAMDADCVRKTIAGISDDEFQRAVDEIVNAETIYVMGVRSASALSGFLANYLGMSFKNVQLIDGRSQSEVYEQILSVGENDVMIGISFPRYSQRTVTAMRYAKSRGASVIALTDSERSPLSDIADCKLLARCEILSYVDSLVAPLSVINALLVAVGMRREEELRSTLGQLERIWDEYNVYEKQDNER